MNGIAEVREQYKQAARTYIEHINKKGEYPQSVNFFQGRMSGLSLALSCLGVNSDEIREMYNTCEEEVRAEKEHDRIHQAATDAANQIEREKEQEQEELDAIERPASQAQVEAKGTSGISEAEKAKRVRWALIGRFKATLNGEQKRVFEKIMEVSE